MTRTKDVATFDAKVYEKKVRAMRERGEEVHDAGRQVYQRTGRLDPNVDIIDRETDRGKVRLSRNSMEKIEDGTVRLTNGPALAVTSFYDGTLSMGENVKRAFEALLELNAMLAGLRHRYNPQIASGIVQDVDDIHPVVQMSQFESDNRIGEQLRLLIPDHNGYDEIEDYDLALAYLMLGTETDIHDFYGLKGYALVIGDQIGRGKITPAKVHDHLRLTIQSETTTKDICRHLQEKWHLYYVQVGSNAGATRNYITGWWEEVMGLGRVIVVPDPYRLAEVQAGLIYVTETAQPTRQGLVDFLLAGGQNRRLSVQQAEKIWAWLQEARPHFGAQARLPGYHDIPKPGDVFARYRDAWPIGHPQSAKGPSTGKAAPPPEIDWSKL